MLLNRPRGTHLAQLRPSPDQPFLVPSTNLRPSLQPPQRAWQPNGGRRSWENSRADAPLRREFCAARSPPFTFRGIRHGRGVIAGRCPRFLSPVSGRAGGRRKEVGTLPGRPDALTNRLTALLKTYFP